MNAVELGDIPTVEFFKGLRNEEILTELSTALYRVHLNECRAENTNMNAKSKTSYNSS